jgi:hypothetical protein
MRTDQGGPCHLDTCQLATFEEDPGDRGRRAVTRYVGRLSTEKRNAGGEDGDHQQGHHNCARRPCALSPALRVLLGRDDAFIGAHLQGNHFRDTAQAPPLLSVCADLIVQAECFFEHEMADLTAAERPTHGGPTAYKPLQSTAFGPA